MDSYKNFVTFKTPTTLLRLHKKEAELLRPYFQAELERALATFEKKYKVQARQAGAGGGVSGPRGFRRADDGHAGAGRAGRDLRLRGGHGQPVGPQAGQFHWASTLWHELSHVFVLTATKHRVPRWFTEGLAVHEETAASPDWGDRLSAEVIEAIRGKKLLPIAELDRGFVHPTYPAQVVVIYYQAGKICDYITEKCGYDRSCSR